MIFGHRRSPSASSSRFLEKLAKAAGPVSPRSTMASPAVAMWGGAYVPESYKRNLPPVTETMGGWMTRETDAPRRTHRQRAPYDPGSGELSSSMSSLNRPAVRRVSLSTASPVSSGLGDFVNARRESRSRRPVRSTSICTGSVRSFRSTRLKEYEKTYTPSVCSVKSVPKDFIIIDRHVGETTMLQATSILQWDHVVTSAMPAEDDEAVNEPYAWYARETAREEFYQERVLDDDQRSISSKSSFSSCGSVKEPEILTLASRVRRSILRRMPGKRVPVDHNDWTFESHTYPRYCPVCDDDEFEDYADFLRHSDQMHEWGLYRCRHCPRWYPSRWQTKYCGRYCTEEYDVARGYTRPWLGRQQVVVKKESKVKTAFRWTLQVLHK